MFSAGPQPRDVASVLLPTMSLAALLRVNVAPPSTSYLRQHKLVAKSTDANLDHGERIQVCLNAKYGAEAAVDFLVFASGESGGREIPYGFYREFIEEELGMTFTPARRMAMRRSFKYYALKKSTGAITRVALRGDRGRASARGSGGKQNSKKGAVLGFYLLQYFVDVVEKLHCRADSLLLMNRARALRVELLRDGHREYQLPKLIGNAGCQWLLRWRKERGISMQVTGMKLKGERWFAELRSCSRTNSD